MALSATGAKAQTYQVPCPTGYNPLQGSRTVGPSGLIAYLCVNSSGAVVFVGQCANPTSNPTPANCGSGGGGPVSITGTSPIVVTPSPTTGTGVVSCPTCGTGSSTGPSFNILDYGGTPDGSTNNNTAMAAAFTASNAVTAGVPIVFFPCKETVGCQYNYNGAGVSPINPTVPTTIICDDGVTLDDTGTAHMIDVGNGISGYLGKFRVTGCKFIGASVTAGIYLNAGTVTDSHYLEFGEIDHNTFYDFPVGSTAITGTGNIFNWLYDYNYYWTDNDVAGKFLDVTGGVSSGNNQVTAHHNLVYCSDAVTGIAGCTSSGAGIIVSGVGSMITDNFIITMNPDIQVTENGGQSHVTGNNLESVPFGSAPPIVFGQSGDAPSTTIPGIVIDNNYTHMNHTGAWIGPGSANDLFVGERISNNRFLETEGPTALVVENPLTGQTGNIAEGNTCGTDGVQCLPVHALANGTAVTPEPWLNPTALSYSDGFNRANGALILPWFGPGSGATGTIVSNVATCAVGVCVAWYGQDIPATQHNGVLIGTVPTGSDAVGVYTRASQGTTNTLTDMQCAYIAGTGIQMYKQINTTATQLGPTYTATTPVAGDWIYLDSIGSLHTCYLLHGNLITGVGNLIAVVPTQVDSSVTQGYAGMLIIGASGTLAGFSTQTTP